MTRQQAQALQRIGGAIIEACDAAQPFGAPGGHLYAALMSQGCTLEQFEQIMAGLQRAGMVEREGECYRATDKGRTFAAMVPA
jgi:hypothetical protein